MKDPEAPDIFSKYTTVDSFLNIKEKAKIIVADYSQLKKDFVHLRDKSDQEINTWLLDNTCLMSIKNVKYFNALINDGDKILEYIADKSKIINGYRLLHYGRAAAINVSKDYQIILDIKKKAMNVINVYSLIKMKL